MKKIWSTLQLPPAASFPAAGWFPSCALPGVLFTVLVLGPGCKREEPQPPSPSAEAAPPANQPASKAPPGKLQTVGPPLDIVPGRGIGPIRFGATFATVERHMMHPCDVRTETKCIYVDQAVEYTMKDGVVAHIQLHLRDRPAPKTQAGAPRSYGTFYGGLRPEIMLGLHRHVAMEELKPADRVETLPQPDANGTVERHHYPGLIVEYDRIPNGNTVLGGFQILPAPDAESPALPKKPRGPSADADTKRTP